MAQRSRSRVAWQPRAPFGRADRRSSRSDLEELAERVPDIIYRYRLRPDPGFDYVSSAVTRITGYTPEEHYADPQLGFKLVHPDDRPLLADLATTGLTTAPLVLRWRRKDGQVIWTEQRNTPVYDEQGELVAVEGIAREVPDPTLRPRESIRLVGALRVDLADQSVWVDGRRVHLTPSEFKLLAALSARPGEIVSRDELMRKLWLSSHVGSGHACETHISTLRRKVERDPKLPERIVTVRGQGYRLEAV